MNRNKRNKTINALIASLVFLSGICANKYIPSIIKDISYTISADDKIFEDFTYTTDENGNAVITGYNNETATTLIIPDEIEGKKVVKIDKSAFEGNKALEKLIISDNVETIAQKAFYKCNSLTYIKLGKNVSAIEKYAFSLCEENYMYWTYDQKQITKLIVPESLKNIHQNAFFYSSVEELIIPDFVTDIDQKLLTFTVGDFKLDEKNKSFVVKDGALYDKDITELKKYSKNTHGSFSLPSTVKTIRFDAFMYCDNLTDVQLASYDQSGNDISQLETIEDYAFYDCNHMTSLIFGKNVKSLGNNSFGFINIKNLEMVQLPDKFESIDQSAFYNCNFIKIKVPASCTKIESGFLNNSSLKEIEVDENNKVYTVVDNILYSKDRSSLIKCPPNYEIKDYIVIPEVKTIEKNAFSHCSTLQNVDLRNNNCGNVEEIKKSAFYSCMNLHTLDLGQKMKRIDGYAFSAYDNPIVYGNTVITQNIMLEDLTIPDDLTDIDDQAFYHCDIANVHIPSSAVSIHERFYCDTKTNSFDVDPDNTVYASENGILYNKEMTVLIKCPHASAITSFTVPDSVETIKAFSFNGVKLQTITIPATTINLEDDIFFNTELKEIKGYENSAAQTYAKNNKYSFTVLSAPANTDPNTKYDLNNDGKVNVFDIIKIQKYVLKRSDN